MKCAVYCRKSNEQNGVADEAKSVARQTEHARGFAAERGWTVSDEHVFSDDAVSGADFKRPGLMRLLNALGKRAPFDVLIVSELSRLGREQLETGYVMKLLAQAGCAVWSYLERKEILMSSPTDKFLLSAMSFAAEVEREKARERSRDAARQRATRGAATGASAFGYRNRRDATGFVAREVVPEEAKVVREIFRLAARGLGLRRIAKTLNAAGALAPKPKRGRPHGWVESTVRVVLNREAYRGTQTWGRRVKRNTWGAVVPRMTPEATWVRVDAPNLRIVSDDEWDRAHDRLEAARLNYLRDTGGRLGGKPPSGVESRYLLVGMCRCAECGAAMQVFERRGNGKKYRVYRCPRARVDACGNTLEAPMKAADDAALALFGEVLSEAVVDRALAKLTEMMDAPPAEDVDTKRARLTAVVRKAEREIANLTTAIASGDAPDALVSALRAREREAKNAAAELRAMDAPVVRVADAEVRAEALKLLDDWRALLARNTVVARQVLTKMLGDSRVTFYPTGDGYELGAAPTVAKLLAAVPALKKAGIPVRGFEPRSRG